MARIHLMVGTQKGAFLFSSDERRKSWEITGPLLKGWSVFDLAFDQRATPTLYATVGHCVYGPAIHISGDLGRTWQQVEHVPKYEAPYQQRKRRRGRLGRRNRARRDNARGHTPAVGKRDRRRKGGLRNRRHLAGMPRRSRDELSPLVIAPF